MNEVHFVAAIGRLDERDDPGQDHRLFFRSVDLYKAYIGAIVRFESCPYGSPNKMPGDAPVALKNSILFKFTATSLGEID